MASCYLIGEGADCMKKEKIVMVCPCCQQEIQENDHVGVTQINSIVHLYCGALPRPGEKIIDEGSYKKILKNIYTPADTGAFCFFQKEYL